MFQQKQLYKAPLHTKKHEIKKQNGLIRDGIGLE